MAATIKVARGIKSIKGALEYGEVFWQQTNAQDEGTLYIGNLDGGTLDDLEIAGARAMKSLYYKGELSGSSFPTDPVIGDYWVMSADGSGDLDGFREGDWVVTVDDNQFVRVDNSSTVEGTVNKVPVFTSPYAVRDSIISQNGAQIEVDGTIRAKASVFVETTDEQATAEIRAVGDSDVVQSIPNHSGTLLNNNSEIDCGDY